MLFRWVPAAVPDEFITVLTWMLSFTMENTAQTSMQEARQEFSDLKSTWRLRKDQGNGWWKLLCTRSSLWCGSPSGSIVLPLLLLLPQFVNVVRYGRIYNDMAISLPIRYFEDGYSYAARLQRLQCTILYWLAWIVIAVVAVAVSRYCLHLFYNVWLTVQRATL